MKRFPIYRQPDSMDYGPACLKMICSFYGKEYHLETLRELCHIAVDGVSLMGISKAAEKIGFKTVPFPKIRLDYFKEKKRDFYYK